MKNWLIRTGRENKAFILFVLLMLIFRSAIADWNEVPTGSMKPTIVEGDRLLVNKLAYDLRVPFTLISLYKISDPARGDIVIFDSAVSEIRLVKRVVGLPGDVVELRDNVLVINGTKVDYSLPSPRKSPRESSGASTSELPSKNYSDKLEDLVGVQHSVRVQNKGTSRSSFSPKIVPDDHYLVLGDNRDNSADSRVIGFVPRNEIVGRAKHVVLSFNYDNYYIPRPERFFHTL